ncbi:MAG: peptidyl-prolyl cis-trans isomerase [Campylobacterales bacterium]|nr:peptidyl-prolyl cis-trans isomerase [Campylobacterales bacterium]
MKKVILSVVAAVTLATASNMQDKVYATVNGENITGSDIAVILRDPRIDFETIPEETKKQVLETVIEQKILSQYAMKSPIVKSDDYKEQIEKLKQTVAFQMWAQDISKTVEVSDKELKEFFDANQAMFRKPLELKARHILVKSEAEAKDLIKELSKSKSVQDDFIALAKSKSVGPSGPNGGDLGWFTQEKMVPEFSQAAVKLAIGEFTKEPVKTQFGYHVIYLEDKKKSEKRTFDEVKVQLKQQLAQQKFVEVLREKAQELKKTAKITYK